jgi:hypothetical protein
MKKLILLSLATNFCLALPLSLSATGTLEDEFGYQGYTEPLAGRLPSEQAYSEIQQMSSYGKELRDKPGGGPGLGEIILPLELTAANVLALMFMGAIYILFRRALGKR